MKVKLEDKWEMMKWLVNFIEENQEQWNIDKEIRYSETRGDILHQHPILTNKERDEVDEAKREELTKEMRWEEWRNKAKARKRKRDNSKVRSEMGLSLANPNPDMREKLTETETELSLAKPTEPETLVVKSSLETGGLLSKTNLVEMRPSLANENEESGGCRAGAS